MKKELSYDEGTFPEQINQRLFVLIVVAIREAIRDARQAERERCAQEAMKAAERPRVTLAGIPKHPDRADRAWARELKAEIKMAEGIAAAIRALSDD